MSLTAWVGIVKYWDRDDDLLICETPYTGSQMWSGPYAAWKHATPPVIGEEVAIAATGDTIVECHRRKGTDTKFTDRAYCPNCDAVTPHVRAATVKTGAISSQRYDMDDNVVSRSATETVLPGFCTVCKGQKSAE